MKIRFTNKDFLLLLGILVAAIVTITAWVFTSQNPSATIPGAIKKSGLTISPSTLIKKAVQPGHTRTINP